MNSFNGILRVVKDVKPSENGKTGTTTGACARPYPFNKGKDGKEQTDFLTLKFIGEKNVDRAVKYLTKGVKVAIQGIVCRDAWKDGEDYKEFNYIIVQNWEFCESKNAKSEDAGESAPSSDTSFMDVPDGLDTDTLPFS